MEHGRKPPYTGGRSFNDLPVETTKTVIVTRTSYEVWEVNIGGGSMMTDDEAKGAAVEIVLDGKAGPPATSTTLRARVDIPFDREE